MRRQPYRYKISENIDILQSEIYIVNKLLKYNMNFNFLSKEELDKEFEIFDSNLHDLSLKVRNDILIKEIKSNNQKSIFSDIYNGIHYVKEFFNILCEVSAETLIESKIEYLNKLIKYEEMSNYQDIINNKTYKEIFNDCIKLKKYDNLIDNEIHLIKLLNLSDEIILEFKMKNKDYSMLANETINKNNHAYELSIKYNVYVEKINTYHSFFKKYIDSSGNINSLEESLNINILHIEKVTKGRFSIHSYKEILTINQSDFLYFYELKEKNKYFNEIITDLENKIKIFNNSKIISYIYSIADISDYYKKIQSKSNTYSKKVLAIENPSFEKIRRYCSNLIANKVANDIEIDLADNGKMYKALMYDAFEEILTKINNSSINIIDFGCKQGINSLLLLDYIREKQLDIEIKNVLLVDDNEELLERAKTHVEVLKNNNMNIILIHNFQEFLNFGVDTSIITINLCFNDEFIKKVNLNDLFLENSYYICISIQSKEYNDKIYESFKFCKIITNKEKKIGKFKKYELIFNIEQIPF